MNDNRKLPSNSTIGMSPLRLNWLLGSNLATDPRDLPAKDGQISGRKNEQNFDKSIHSDTLASGVVERMARGDVEVIFHILKEGYRRKLLLLTGRFAVTCKF